LPLIPYDAWDWIRRELAGLPELPGAGDGWLRGAFHTVRVDVRETADQVIVTADIPGLEGPDDVQITVRDNHLQLSGKVERAVEQQDEHVHRIERFAGRFTRTVPLPAAVRPEAAKATYKNGILEIRLPKRGGSQGSQISVDFH
jgi:HSP20 family protein